ncbi:MAG TPA: metal-dependent transcriptional regulator [Edaphocola sp.]|nr:metal-dependent transcriptional regulator [Edaphocola sp.]
MLSQTEENYLKVLYNLISFRGEASVNEISKQLDIKMPTVNSMMKRLSEKGLVLYESYKPLKLTNEGKKIAALIIRKHRLTEMYLVEKMGFGWEKVHEIAEQIEHIQSEAFFAKMDELLGYPKVDPHGSPIPDINGVLRSETYIPLKDFNVGDKVVFMAVLHSSEDLLSYLNTKKLELGMIIAIIATESFEESITIQYDNNKVETLTSKVSSKLLVKLIK